MTVQSAATVYPADLGKMRFACKCGCCAPFDMEQGLIDAIRAAQVHFGGELIVTSGFRCRQHNTRVGGVEGSHHTRGRAADFIIIGTAPEALADFVQALIGNRAGIGVMPARGRLTGFVHVDLRGTPGARWTYAARRQEGTP